MLYFKNKPLIFVIGILILVCFSSLAAVDDTGPILKKVNKELRQAERDMFSGKTEKAIAALENIKTSLVQIKTSEPNNPKLKTAENKFKKLVKDLERRTGKDLGGGTLTAAAASSTTQLASKPVAKDSPKKDSQPASKEPKQVSTSASSKVPYAARKPLSNANMLLGALDRNLSKLADPNYGGSKDQLVGNMI